MLHRVRSALLISLLLAALGSTSCTTPAAPVPAGAVAARPAVASASPQPAGGALSTTQSGRPYSLLDTTHFKLIYAADARWVATVGELLESAHREFYRSLDRTGLSPRPLAEPLVWVCFDAHGDFESYARQIDNAQVGWTDGYYSMRTNVVAVVKLVGSLGQAAPADRSIAMAAFQPAGPSQQHQLDLTRTTHEAAHQLAFNSGLQKRGVAYPLWLSEGLATNFESDGQGRFGFGRDNPVRRAGLRQACQAGRLSPLSRLVALSQPPAAADQAARDAYAQAWGLFRFLLDRRPAQLKAYLDRLATLPPGDRDEATMLAEFVAAFGPIAELEPHWQRFISEQ